MFTKAELTLIEELRVQGAPLERWAVFFPNHKISDLLKPKPIGYFYGVPVYTKADEFAKQMKKGNVYKWCSQQDEDLKYLFERGLTIGQIIDILKNKFGIERTTGAIGSRLSYLGLI